VVGRGSGGSRRPVLGLRHVLAVCGAVVTRHDPTLEPSGATLYWLAHDDHLGETVGRRAVIDYEAAESKLYFCSPNCGYRDGTTQECSNHLEATRRIVDAALFGEKE
jgi:hypothetical protein